MSKFIFSAVFFGIGLSILGGVGGMLVDHFFGTSPWLALAASFFALSIAFFAVQIAVQKLFAQEAQAQE